MSVYIIRKKKKYYLLEKENGKVIASVSTGISITKKGEKTPKIIEDKKQEYIRDRNVFLKNKTKVLCSELKEKYLKLCEPPIKTKKTYGAVLTAFNEFIRICGDKYLYEYRNDDIDLFLSRKVKETSVHTAHRIRRTLRPAFKQAERWGYISHNPWLDSLKITLPEPEPRFMEKEEFERMILFCSNEVLADAFVWFAYTGVRQAELIKATPKDVLLEKRIIRVQSTALTPNKDKDSRNIEMHKRLVPIYEKYKQQEYLFENPITKKQFSPRSLLEGIAKACKKAGLVHYRIQDLRSTYGMWLINKDAPLKWISQQMGHSSVMVTERHYAKYITKEYTGMIDKLDF